MRGYQPRRFSFNKPGGRCEACEGNGQKKIEMHFLPDVWVECDVCHGSRYNPETLAVHYKGQSIADVLNMRVSEALELFGNIPKIRRVLQTLADVGLDYLSLGQPAPTLSGGEAQRVKLAAELARPNTGRTLYLLDEPTTGLHFDDIAQAARRAESPGRSGQHGHRGRAQPGRHQDGRLGHRPRPGSGRRRRPRRGRGDAGRRRAAESQGQSHTGARSWPECWPPARTPSGPSTIRNAAAAPREGDVALEAVGQDAQDAVGDRRPALAHRRARQPQGQAVPLGGHILDWIDEHIHELGEFGDTNWNQSHASSRSPPPTKSQGWFFHAHTGLEACPAGLPRRPATPSRKPT